MPVSPVTIRGIFAVFETVDGTVFHAAVDHWDRLLAVASDCIGSTEPPYSSGRAVGDMCIALGVH